MSTVVANAAIGLEGIDDVSLTLIASGVLAFATCEATALLAVWRQLDHIAVVGIVAAIAVIAASVDRATSH